MVNRHRRASDGKSYTFTETLKKTVELQLHLDEKLEEREELRFRKRHAILSKQLSIELPLTLREVESLMLIYYHFQKQDKSLLGMSKLSFKDILHELDVGNPVLVDHIAYIFDKSPSPYMSLENWVRAMALFLRGSFEDKIRHCFNAYVPFVEGGIGRDRMARLLKGSVIGGEDVEDEIRDLAEIILKKMDVDRDGIISYSDFKQAVTQEPLMMECLGECLPTRLAVKSLLLTFTPYIGKL